MDRLRRKRFLMGVYAGMFVMSGCATITGNTYEGYLQSGEIHAGYLHSADLWLFNGEKGCRVVIADAVKPGENPPEIYLFPPGSTECEAHAGLLSKSCRVLDHELEYTGEYTLVIHRDGPNHEGVYRLSLAKLPEDGCFSIDPDDPDGNLIKSNCILPEECIGGWEVAALAGIPVVTPYMTAPAAVLINSGLGTIGRILDFRGRERARIVANFHHDRELETEASTR